jgi:hypothetical protein
MSINLINLVVINIKLIIRDIVVIMIHNNEVVLLVIIIIIMHSYFLE